MKSLLIVYHSQSGASAQLARAAWHGAQLEADISVSVSRVWDVGVQELAQVDGVLLVTAENSGALSGGMKDFLDGFYCMKKLKIPALFAQASALLKRALISDTELYTYLENQRRGLQIAYQFLDIKE